ncbi:hypothetical protein MTO96_005329 [Rhipicephalus appendiculatus]
MPASFIVWFSLISMGFIKEARAPGCRTLRFLAKGSSPILSLGAPKVAKGILLSIRVVNPDESTGQPTYAAQVPIHFSGGRVTTGPVVYGREQPCPEDHVHGSRQLQTIVGSYSGRGSRGSPAYSPSHTTRMRCRMPRATASASRSRLAYRALPRRTSTTASHTPCPRQGGPHYQQSYQVAQAPSAAYQSVGDGKGYPGTAYAHGGHAYQVVAQGGDGQEHVYVTAHPGAHGGHGGATAVAQKSYSPYAVQDTYSGGYGAGGHAAYAAAPGYAGGPSYGGGGQGGASYAALVGRGYAAAAGPSYGGSAGPSYGGAAGPAAGGYDKPQYQVAAVYPGAQPTYGVNAAAFKAAAAAKAYGTYGGSASGGGEEQTIIVASDGPAGGDGSGKSYGSYQGAAGPSYQVASAAAQSYKPGQQQQQQQQYAGPHQQAFSRYPDSGSGSYYSGTSFAEANRLALQKYNALMSRAASIVGGPQNLKAVTARYNIPWNW